MTMDKRLVQHWIDQLRSGDWQQGNYYLCRLTDNGPSYCCLGVLNEITGNPTVLSTRTHNGAPVLAYLNGGPGNGNPQIMANHVFLEEVGLNTDQVYTLCMMNDDGHSFDEIADYLEKELL